MSRQQPATAGALLTEHVGHWLRAIDQRRLRCHECKVTIVTPLEDLPTPAKVSRRKPPPKMTCPAWCTECFVDDDTAGTRFHRSDDHPVATGSTAAAYATVFSNPRTRGFEELEIHTDWSALTAAQAREAGAALVAFAARIEIGVHSG